MADTSAETFPFIWAAGLDAKGQQALTAHEAAARHGSSPDNAYKWAKRARVKWRRVREDRGGRIREVHRQSGIARRELPSNGTTWAEQHALGRCVTDAARAMGKAVTTGHRWADYHGKAWPKGSTLPECRQRQSQGLVALYRRNPAAADYQTRRLRKMDGDREAGYRDWCRDPARNRLANLTADERAQYDLMIRKKYTSDEAMIALGRPELTRARFNPRPQSDPTTMLRERMAASAAQTAARLAKRDHAQADHWQEHAA